MRIRRCAETVTEDIWKSLAFVDFRGTVNVETKCFSEFAVELAGPDGTNCSHTQSRLVAEVCDAYERCQRTCVKRIEGHCDGNRRKRGRRREHTPDVADML